MGVHTGTGKNIPPTHRSTRKDATSNPSFYISLDADDMTNVAAELVDWACSRMVTALVGHE